MSLLAHDLRRNYCSLIKFCSGPASKPTSVINPDTCFGYLVQNSPSDCLRISLPKYFRRLSCRPGHILRRCTTSSGICIAHASQTGLCASEDLNFRRRGLQFALSWLMSTSALQVDKPGCCSSSSPSSKHNSIEICLSFDVVRTMENGMACRQCSVVGFRN